jgi:RecB family exonuclease
VAFRQDPLLRSWRRPSTYSVLGEVAHAIAEIARARRDWPQDPDPLRARIEACWDEEITRGFTRLAAAWNPAQPPPPEEWPGYQLTRARTLRRPLKLLTERRAVERKQTPSRDVEVEVELHDSTTGLFGRADRIEQDRDSTRIIDLKTGLSQGDPTEAQHRQLLLYAVLVQRNTGTWPHEIAIENASGQQTALPLDPSAAIAALDEVTRAVDLYNTHLNAGAEHTTANPTAESCRWCPFRVLCQPYWTLLTSSWRHQDLLGTIVESGDTPRGVYAHVQIESPTDLSDRRINIKALPTTPPSSAHRIAAVDLATHVDATDTTARWNTLVRLW